MKYFLTVIWVIVCISVLAISHIHWNQKTVAVKAVEPITQETVESAIEPYMSLAANWPETAKGQLQLALETEKPFKILFVGSSAIEWEQAVTQSLTESFGSERISTAIHTYDSTSTDLITENKHVEFAAEKADLLVIEPFLLNDNSKLEIEETLANLTTIMEAVKAENPNTTCILQPSYPIYLPKYYSVQVEALKAYSEENNVTFLDHWTAWPATDNPEIKDYLTKGQDGPNENGNQVWAQFLINYFVNK
jgi:hypothetical protein